MSRQRRCCSSVLITTSTIWRCVRACNEERVFLSLPISFSLFFFCYFMKKNSYSLFACVRFHHRGPRTHCWQSCSRGNWYFFFPKVFDFSCAFLILKGENVLYIVLNMLLRCFTILFFSFFLSFSLSIYIYIDLKMGLLVRAHFHISSACRAR